MLTSFKTILQLANKKLYLLNLRFQNKQNTHLWAEYMLIWN